MSDILGEAIRQAANSQAAYVRTADALARSERDCHAARALVRRFFSLSEEPVVPDARGQALRDLQAECRALPWIEEER